MAPPAEAGRTYRVGVFGGSFDPPHTGHVTVAGEVADALALDRVLWIPAHIPPHKQEARITPGAVRLEMVRAAIAGDPRFAACDLELLRPGPSYTVDTLRELTGRYPGAELFLILGADQVAALEHGWRDPVEILRLATLALMDRGGRAALAVAPPLPGMERAVHVPVSRIDVSSTRIRAALAEGRDVSAWVPGPVLEIVEREGLYRG